MIDIARRQILPASIEYAGKVASSLASMKSVSAKSSIVEKLLSELTTTIDSFGKNIDTLESALAQNGHGGGVLKHAEYYRDIVFTAMGKLRTDGDKLETLVDAAIWPLPTYADILFNI